MNHKRDSLPEDVAAQLETEAAAKSMTLHHSFKIELINYSRHVGVEDLPPEKLKLVLTEIGKLAIHRAGEQARIGKREVPGEDVRAVIAMLCTAFTHCYKAATRILETSESAASI
jgi:hypothetical protein